MSFDIRGLCQRPFFKLVAKGALKHSVLVVDDEVGKTLACLGGLDFLYSIGVANVVSCKVFSEPVSSLQYISRIDGIRPYYVNNNSSKSPGRHLVFLVSDFLWLYEINFVNALRSLSEGMHAFYEKITILTTVTEKSHAICLKFGGRNNKFVKTTEASCTDSPFLDATDSSSFQYDKYAAHLSKTVLSEIKSLQSTEGAHEIDRDVNGVAQLCKINIQYFPLHCRPLSVKNIYSSSDQKRDDEDNSAKLDQVPFELFELCSPLSKVWFPALPRIFPEEKRKTYRNDMNKINSKDFPESHRCNLKILSDVLVCTMMQLNLDPRGSSFCIGHKHSAKIIGETTIMNLSDGPDGILPTSQLEGRKKASFLMYDRTMDMVAPTSLSATNLKLDDIVKQKISVMENMQLHSFNVDDTVAQMGDTIKSILDSTTAVPPAYILCMLFRAASLLTPGALTPEHLNFVKESLVDVLLNSKEMLDMILVLLGKEKIELGDLKSDRASIMQGRAPSPVKSEDDFLEWDDDDPWGSEAENEKMTEAKGGVENGISNAWNEGDDEDLLGGDSQAESNTTALKGLAMVENESTIQQIAETITDAVHAINLARSGLNDFKDVRTDGGYEPLISRLIAMFYRDVEPTALKDLSILKDYNAPETTVTESLTGLLGGFFSMTGANGGNAQPNIGTEDPGRCSKILDRPLLFVFVVGGLTALEIQHIISTILNNRGLQHENVTVLVGCTKFEGEEANGRTAALSHFFDP